MKVSDSVAIAIRDAVDESMGVYCAEFNGIKRTPWQDGWNAYGEELLERRIAVDEWFKALPDEDANIIGEMITADALSIDVDKDRKVHICFDTSDLFAWGYADREEITSPDMLRQVYAAFQRHPTWGICAWWALEQKTKPQKPVEKKLRDACLWDDVCDAACPNKWGN